MGIAVSATWHLPTVALFPDRVEHRLINGVHGAIRTNYGGRMCLTDASGKRDDFGHHHAVSEVPAH